MSVRIVFNYFGFFVSWQTLAVDLLRKLLVLSELLSATIYLSNLISSKQSKVFIFLFGLHFYQILLREFNDIFRLFSNRIYLYLHLILRIKTTKQLRRPFMLVFLYLVIKFIGQRLWRFQIVFLRVRFFCLWFVLTGSFNCFFKCSCQLFTAILFCKY